MAGDLSVITKIYDLIIWSIPHIAKFPRSHRFILGEIIESNLYSILEDIIEAKYTKEKLPILQKTNIKLEKLRYQMRIAKDLKILPLNSYEFAAKSIVNIGNEIGGWIKQQGNKKNE